MVRGTQIFFVLVRKWSTRILFHGMEHVDTKKKTTNEKRKPIVPASVSKVMPKEMKPMIVDASLITPIAAINLQGCLSSDPKSQDPEAVLSNIHEPMNLSTGDSEVK
jgi:hypothetical protein